MRVPLIGLGTFAASLVAVHLLVLNALPEYIMTKARERFVASGLPVHQWQMAPRVTPQSQTIVRSSPDLAYAICLIDLSGGPVTLSVPTWPDYGSLSIFDSGTDNVYAGSLDARMSGAPDVRRVLVAQAGQLVKAAPDMDVVRVNQPEALALIRRLAPSQALHETAAAFVPLSSCGPL